PTAVAIDLVVSRHSYETSATIPCPANKLTTPGHRNWHGSAHDRDENSNQSNTSALRNGTPRLSVSATMGGARSCWLCYAQRLQVDEAADTFFFDRQLRCLPKPRATYASGTKTWLVLQAPDENKELLGFVSQIGLSIRYSGCFLPARLDPLQLGDRVVQHSLYHGFVPHLVFESFRRQEEMIRHGIHFGVTRSYRVRFRIGFSRSLEIVTAPGESSGNLPGFITYPSA